MVQVIYEWITTKLEPDTWLVVQAFSATIKDLVGGLTDALNFLLKLEAAELPSIDKLDEYLELIRALFFSFGEGIEETPEEIRAAGSGVDSELGILTGKLDAWSWYSLGTDLTTSLANGIGAARRYLRNVLNAVQDVIAPEAGEHGWPSTWHFYTLGYQYMDWLAAGIRDGTARVEDALGALFGLFPRSPAEWGPFATLPDEKWVTEWMSGFAGAFETGVGRLAGLPGLTVEPTLTGGDWGAARPIHIEVNLNDAVIRDERSTMTTGVYEIKNKLNGKAYLGSSGNIERRWRAHRQMLCDGCHPNAHLQAAWKLYGEHAFAFTVLQEVESDALVSTEQAHLDTYLAQDSCYNMATIAGPGGRGRPVSEETRRKLSAAKMGELHPMWGKQHTEESKRKIRAAMMGNQYALGYKHTEESKRKLSAAMMGNQHSLGHKHTEESKRKMGAAKMGNQNHLGHKHAEETKRKISLAKMGKKPPPFTEEHKRKLGAAMMGNQNALGHKHTEETRRKIGLARMGKKHTDATRRKMREAQKRRRAREKASKEDIQ